jgi:hypothetical protein
MREYYPICNLYLDNGEAGLFFYRALRFSTHCEYNVYTTEKDPQWFTSFPHHKLIYAKNIHKKTDETGFIDIEFKNEQFKITTDLIRQEFNAESIELDIAITELEMFKEEHFILDYLIDFEKDFIFLGKCKDENKDINIYRERQYIEIAMKIAKMLKNRIDIQLNSILTLKCQIYAGTLKINYYINTMNKRFELYRAYGVNIPLLLVQSLLKRKIGVTFMVNPSNIIEIDGRYKYTFSQSCYVFDLDETLICKGIPIYELVNFVKKLKSMGYRVELLTRHTFHILDTLKSIGLYEKDFDLIQKVEIEEKKSSFIKRTSIFVDNEFPQRKDVRERVGCNVLDLDQIDFLNIEG